MEVVLQLVTGTNPLMRANLTDRLQTADYGLQIVACVWEQRKTEEWDFWCFARAKNGASAKKRKRGMGKRKEVTACRQTPGI